MSNYEAPLVPEGGPSDLRVEAWTSAPQGRVDRLGKWRNPIGIVGAGFIADIVAAALLPTSARLVAVASRRADVAAAFAHANGIARHHGLDGRCATLVGDVHHLHTRHFAEVCCAQVRRRLPCTSAARSGTASATASQMSAMFQSTVRVSP